MQAAHLAQHPVDAVAEAQEPLFRLKVDIRGAALDRVGQQGIDQAHHRLAVFIALRGQALVVEFPRFYFVQDAVNGQLVAVEAVDGFIDVRLRGQHRNHFRAAAQVGVELVQGNDVKGIHQRHFQQPARRVIADGRGLQAPGQVFRDHGQGFGVGHDGVQVNLLLSERAADDVVDDRLGGKPQAHEDPARLLAALLLLQQGNFQLVGGNNAFADEDLAQAQVRVRHGYGLLNALMRLTTGRISRPEALCSTSFRVAR